MRLAIAARRAGMTDREIAARFGVSPAAISMRLIRARRMGMDVPPPNRERGSTRVYTLSLSYLENIGDAHLIN